jgi:hypothetical protein
MKHHIDNLKNFGFRDETVVEEPGINAKLNEVQAAYGLLQLKYIDKLILRRRDIALLYRELLADVPGVRFLPIWKGSRTDTHIFPFSSMWKSTGKAAMPCTTGLKDIISSPEDTSIRLSAPLTLIAIFQARVTRICHTLRKLQIMSFACRCTRIWKSLMSS